MRKILFLFVFLIILSGGFFQATVHKTEARVATLTLRSNPTVTAGYSQITHTVTIEFLNLTGVKSISYLLTYNANGILQGVSGNFTVNSDKIVKEIYLGTCSGSVCTPHTNVKKIKLAATFTLTDNSTKTKTLTVN